MGCEILLDVTERRTELYLVRLGQGSVRWQDVVHGSGADYAVAFPKYWERIDAPRIRRSVRGLYIDLTQNRFPRLHNLPVAIHELRGQSHWEKV